MADPTTPAWRRKMERHVDIAEGLLAARPEDWGAAWCIEAAGVLALYPKVMADLAAAEAQIAEVRREGMMEAAGIALAFRDGNPNAMQRMQYWGPRIVAAIRAASGGRDGER